MSIAKTMRNLLGFGDSNIFNLPDCNWNSASQVANPLRPGAHPKSRRVAFPQIAFFLYRFTFEHVHFVCWQILRQPHEIEMFRPQVHASRSICATLASWSVCWRLWPWLLWCFAWFGGILLGLGIQCSKFFGQQLRLFFWSLVPDVEANFE